MPGVSETANTLLETERNLMCLLESGTVEDRVTALRAYSVALIAHHNAVEANKRCSCGQPRA